MHHTVELLVAEKSPKSLLISNAADGKSFAVHVLQMTRGEIVENPDAMSPVQQVEGGGAADITGSSCDQNPEFCVRTGNHESPV